MALLWGAATLTCPLNFGVSCAKSIGPQNGAIIPENSAKENARLKEKQLHNK